MRLRKRPEGGGRGLPGVGGLAPGCNVDENDGRDWEKKVPVFERDEGAEIDMGKPERLRSSFSKRPFRSAEVSSMPSIWRRCSFSCSRRLISVSRSVAQSKSVKWERRTSSGVGEEGWESVPGDCWSRGCSPAMQRIRARRFCERRRRLMDVVVELNRSVCMECDSEATRRDS